MIWQPRYRFGRRLTVPYDVCGSLRPWARSLPSEVHSMPPGGDWRMTAREPAKETRTVLGGEEVAVDLRMGRRSLVRRKGPRMLVW